MTSFFSNLEIASIDLSKTLVHTLVDVARQGKHIHVRVADLGRKLTPKICCHC